MVIWVAYAAVVAGLLAAGGLALERISKTVGWTRLGVVTPPDGFSPYPNPVFDGDQVSAVTRDELGIERVVRYRISVGDETQ